MLPQEVIRRKRDGGVLDQDEIAFMVRGITDGSVSEGQIGALAMAIFLQGMSSDEAVTLTREMTRSGTVLEWSLDGPVVDKHSTGGVGDKVSLLLAPMIAACGGYVPMISGRGLGHTGGTLDKLDSISGYNTSPDIDLFRRVVSQAGCAIIGQTADLAPADGRLYAIRDVTATVESIPLITASILSKKLAAGLDALVMDIKTGSGAFAADRAMAEALAESIVTTANGAGMATSALITDMNQVLGRTAGNALEVRESIDFLRGRARDLRLRQVTTELAAEILVLAGLSPGHEEARVSLDAALDGGQAAEHFARMVAALGGPSDILERPGKSLPKSPVMKPVFPEGEGFITAIDTRAVGLAIIELGGGRCRASDAIDHAVGLSEVAALGSEVGPHRPLALVHARDEAQVEQAMASLRLAFSVGDEAPARTPLILGRLGRPEP